MARLSVNFVDAAELRMKLPGQLGARGLGEAGFVAGYCAIIAQPRGWLIVCARMRHPTHTCSSMEYGDTNR
jgi:hypothetical protein